MENLLMQLGTLIVTAVLFYFVIWPNLPDRMRIFLRDLFWPIHGKAETKKFIGLAVIMLAVLFNYSMLRGIKDTLINTAPSGGTEVISSLKSLLVLPSALVFFVIYSKLSQWFNQERVFYILVSFFAIYFLVFAFVIFPNKEMLHASDATIAALSAKAPSFRYIISMIGLWGFSSYYVLAELWGSAVLSLLFWQFANEITTTTESKRFYPMIALFSNIALIITGKVSNIFAEMTKTDANAWQQVMYYVGPTVALVAVLIMVVYYFMRRDKDCRKEEVTVKKQKVKLSFFQSMAYLVRNPYLLLLATLVLSYGISINLIEAVWKNQLKIYFAGNEVAYFKFMGDFFIVQAWTSIGVVFFTKSLVKVFGWTVGAIITPIVIAVTGLLFFVFILNQSSFDQYLAAYSVSALYAAVFMGMYLNVFSKAFKYAHFDPTKEMAYIPLDEESRTKGKAAVDVIGGRLGKALGGYTLTFMFMFFTGANITTVTPYLGVIIGIILTIWILAVLALAKKYKKLTGEA